MANGWRDNNSRYLVLDDRELYSPDGSTVWAFVIAALIPMMAAYITLNELCPLTASLENLHSTAVQ